MVGFYHVTFVTLFLDSLLFFQLWLDSKFQMVKLFACAVSVTPYIHKTF